MGIAASTGSWPKVSGKKNTHPGPPPAGEAAYGHTEPSPLRPEGPTNLRKGRLYQSLVYSEIVIVTPFDSTPPISNERSTASPVAASPGIRAFT